MNHGIQNHKINNNINDNFFFKNRYNDYGVHYFGWKGVLKSFLNFISQQKEIFSEMKFKKKYLFDEWIEKLLIWGYKIKETEREKEIEKNVKMFEPYHLITFIHNPPYEKYAKMTENEKEYMKENIILQNDQQMNKNLFCLLEKYNLKQKIVYLYTLSNSHKEYLYYRYPEYRDKFVSVHHPIEMKEEDFTFDFDSFMEKKRIIHIGWWLRNFKTFVDFSPHSDFEKYILIKKGISEKWKKISTKFNLNKIKLIHELENRFYENLFRDSCMFLDLEDAVANNVVLECIKFNTPIIINKIASVVEYLGIDYPLYFSNDEDLKKIESYSSLEFAKKVSDAHDYLLNMDKSHIELITFHKKIFYDLQKLTVTENTIYRLTWICLLETKEDIDYVDGLIEQFLNQEYDDKLILTFLVPQNMSHLHDFLQKMEKYKKNNISYLMLEDDERDLNSCIHSVNTDYLTFINVNDTFCAKYSITFIDYLDETPGCDFAFSSFSLRNTENNNLTPHYYEKDSQLFINDIQKGVLFPSGAFVWRKNIHTLLDRRFIKKDTYKIDDDVFKLFISKCLLNHLNIFCISDEILYACIRNI